MKSFKEFSEATKVRGFPGKTSTVSVSRDNIEHAHALSSDLATANGRLPHVRIKHNAKDNTFEIHTSRRDKNGSPTGPAAVTKHDEGSFIQHANRVLSKVHPDFYPPATHASMTTDGKKFRFKLGR